MGSILVPLGLLYQWLPWPRGKVEWRWFLLSLTLIAMAIDVVRIHDRRIGRYFRQFFRPSDPRARACEPARLDVSPDRRLARGRDLSAAAIAAAALGFTILGDAMAALVGKSLWAQAAVRQDAPGLRRGPRGMPAVGGVPAPPRGWVAWPVAVAGALVARSGSELLPIPLDDNLGMTLFAGCTMKLLGASGMEPPATRTRVTADRGSALELAREGRHAEALAGLTSLLEKSGLHVQHRSILPQARSPAASRAWRRRPAISRAPERALSQAHPDRAELSGSPFPARVRAAAKAAAVPAARRFSLEAALKLNPRYVAARSPGWRAAGRARRAAGRGAPDVPARLGEDPALSGTARAFQQGTEEPRARRLGQKRARCSNVRSSR